MSTQKTPFVLTQMLLEVWQVAPQDTLGECLHFRAPRSAAELARIQNYRWNWHKIPHATSGPL